MPLKVTNLGTSDLWWLTWGIQSRYFDPSVNAALMFEAESRTPLGTSALVAGPTGASGTGSNVVRETGLSTTYRALVSTQASGAGAHLSHVGTYRAYARVQTPVTNGGTVTVALEWAVGDFARWTRNADNALDTTWEGSWRLVDLGLVTIPKAAQGTQRWEGRLLGKSTILGDDVDVDIFPILVPVDEGSGDVKTVFRSPTPTAFSAQDEFTGIAASTALNARVAPIGGTWATSGAATDFTAFDLGSEEVMVRDVSGTRYAVLGATSFTNIEVGVAIQFEQPTEGKPGLLARWTDASNHFFAHANANGSGTLEAGILLAGSETILASAPLSLAQDVWYSLRAVVYASGRLIVQMLNSSGQIIASVTASHTALATGGTLATGKPGIADRGAGFLFRYYDAFYVTVPAVDAVIFAGRSLELYSDKMIREDAAGAVWTQLAPEGDYLKVPPAGREGRRARLVVLGSVFDPATGPHAFVPLSVTETYTPRYLVAPQA